MADKVCANCGAEVPAAAVFCTQCGSRELTVTTADPLAGSPAIAPDSPTVVVDEVAEAPSFGAPSGPPPGPPTGPVGGVGSFDEPTMADHTAVVEPTTQWPTPPGAPSPTPVGAAPAGSPSPYGAPTPAPTGQVAGTSGGGRFGAAIVLLGGAGAIVGAFLEWMTITPELADTVSLDGWALSDDAKIALGLGAVAVIAAVVVLAGIGRSVLRIVAAILGILLVGLGAYDTYDILQKLPDELEEAGVSGVEIAAPGLGLILIIAGGAIVLLGALAMSGTSSGTNGAPTATAPGTTTAPQPGFAGGAPGYATPTAPPAGAMPPPGGYAPPSGGYPPPAGGTTPPSGGYPQPPPFS